MARMTETEADALDDEITNADITLKPSETGVFSRQREAARQRELLNALDRECSGYIMTRAAADNKMPLQVLDELLHKQILAAD